MGRLHLCPVRHRLEQLLAGPGVRVSPSAAGGRPAAFLRAKPGLDRQNACVWASEPHRLADYNRVDLDLTHEPFMRVLRTEPLFVGDATVVLPLPD